jgi:hypothetical protein
VVPFFSARIGGAGALFDWLSLEGEEAGSCAKHLSFKTGKPGELGPGLRWKRKGGSNYDLHADNPADFCWPDLGVDRLDP